nr:ribonuclease H-like domain-containing protein [Tanacetum cinerariifolium]
MYNVDLKNVAPSGGKFDGKADEGFFIGYSTNSKAFRVYNSRTRIVEENMHVKFHENTPNIVGNGPNWLFDIDALTKSMTISQLLQEINLMVVRDSPGNRFKPSGEEEKKDTRDPRNEESAALITEEPRVNQEKDSVNSTNRVNAVSSAVNAASNEVNAIGRKSIIKLPDDLNMPNLEDISIYEDSNEDVFGAEAYL